MRAAVVFQPLSVLSLSVSCRVGLFNCGPGGQIQVPRFLIPRLLEARAPCFFFCLLTTTGSLNFNVPGPRKK